MRQQDATKRKQWRGWIQQWQASGKTAEEFGREHGVSASTVYWWRKELGRQLPAVRANVQSPSIAFVQLPLKAAVMNGARGESLEVVLRGERRVRVPDSFSAQTLQAVMRALDAIG